MHLISPNHHLCTTLKQNVCSSYVVTLKGLLVYKAKSYLTYIHTLFMRETRMGTSRMCVSFGVVFVTKILGIGCILLQNCYETGVLFLPEILRIVVKTPVKNLIHILGLGLTIPPYILELDHNRGSCSLHPHVTP